MPGPGRGDGRVHESFPGAVPVHDVGNDPVEELASVGPVAMLQDLAVVCTLGITHSERNGHHYFAGLSMYPDAIQDAVLRAHGTLYRRHEGGFPTLAVKSGTLDVGSIMDAPFGYGFDLDSTQFTPLSDWSADSLAL